MGFMEEPIKVLPQSRPPTEVYPRRAETVRKWRTRAASAQGDPALLLVNGHSASGLPSGTRCW